MLAIYDNNRNDEDHETVFITVDNIEQAQMLEEMELYDLLVVAYNYDKFEHSGVQSIAQYLNPDPTMPHSIDKALSLMSVRKLVDYFKCNRTKKDLKALMVQLKKMGLVGKTTNG